MLFHIGSNTWYSMTSDLVLLENTSTVNVQSDNLITKYINRKKKLL